MSTEKTYTLAQARAEFSHRDCAERGHAPHMTVETVGEPVAACAFCACGLYRWEPIKTVRTAGEPRCVPSCRCAVSSGASA